MKNLPNQTGPVKGAELSNGAKLYRWILSARPDLWNVSSAVGELGVAERTLRRWRSEILGPDNSGHLRQRAATGAGIRPPTAKTATYGSGRPPTAIPESGHLRQRAATDGQLSLRGDLGGKDEPSKSPKPKTEKKARKVERNPLPTDWPDTVLDAWEDFIQMRKEKRQTPTPTAHNALLKKVNGWDHARIEAALIISTENSWTGLFEPGTKNKPQPQRRTFGDVARDLDRTVDARPSTNGLSYGKP